MKNIFKNGFSKIGTNPSKYFNNYHIHLNIYPKGKILNIINLSICDNQFEIFKANSETTLRQNIDAWIWMGFIIKIDNTIIKIIDELSQDKLLEHIKYTLFIESDKLVNKHRNTILIKLLSLNDKENINFSLLDLTYDDVLKECGNFENLLSKDIEYIKLIKKIWGQQKNEK